MMINKGLPNLIKTLFKFSTADPTRLKSIRNHTPLTQYDNLNSVQRQHQVNTARIIQDDETKIKFLVEEGGFPGCSDLGICIKLGTQNQNSKNAGSLQYLKNFVHMKPSFQEIIQNYQFLQQTGSTFDFNYDALTSYAKCSFFEEDKNVMIDLLLDLVIQEKNMFEDNFPTEAILQNITELVRRTAYGDKGLGMPSTGLGNVLTNKQFLAFQQNITPHNMLISISNIHNPDETIKAILDKIKKRYPQFLRREAPKQTVSEYVGGFRSFQSNSDFFQFAVAFPSIPFKSEKMELYNVLRVLLGNASSFSSGGPGKGMHSRCTKNLLNKVACVEKASFINEHYEETGLFGLTVGGPHSGPIDVIDCTLKELKKLSYTIPQQQLNRSKNILISSIYTNIQRQSDRLEEMSKHIYSYGRLRLNEFEGKIRQVTGQQIKQTMKELFTKKPTLVYSGNQQSISKAPSIDKLQQIYNKVIKQI